VSGRGLSRRRFVTALAGAGLTGAAVAAVGLGRKNVRRRSTEAADAATDAAIDTLVDRLASSSSEEVLGVAASRRG